jgi:transposase
MRLDGVLRRQKSLALSEEANRIAWKAQQRLHKRFAALTARDKETNVAATAIARELLGFMWAIAVHTEAQHKQSKAA